MMKIRILRFQLDTDATLGKLYVDDSFRCYTCEDTVRAPDAPKIFGQTAIPAGVYNVEITHSPHFGRDLPLLDAVPGFSGVRIHPGNTPADTEGCILVGRGLLPKGVSESRAAFEPLFTEIQSALAAGAVTLEIG
jgi:hypothetical protein